MYIILILIVLFSSFTLAQQPGPERGNFDPDSNFVFKSPRPLLDLEGNKGELNNTFGANLTFSESGFGFGIFWGQKFGSNIQGTIEAFGSGVRNADEFDQWNGYEWRVPNKVNRLFMFPLMAGINYQVLEDKIFDSFKPYISAGAGTAFIIAAPYEREFFDSFSHADTYWKPGGYFGLGAKFGGIGRSHQGISIRYYIIPFGGDGLESLAGLPIKDFGGLFINLSLGVNY